MTSLIETAPDGTPEQIHRQVTAGLDGILTAKRKDVAWKLVSVRKAYESRGSCPGRTPAWLRRPSH
jgi:hypothetical protein